MSHPFVFAYLLAGFVNFAFCFALRATISPATGGRIGWVTWASCLVDWLIWPFSLLMFCIAAVIIYHKQIDITKEPAK